MPDPNPSELCLCGCGQKTPIAKLSNKRRGQVKDRPIKYVHGHHRRGRTGQNAPGWKGGRISDGRGYVKILIPDHPEADRDGYVREHRYVWEIANARRLNPGEVVHHINGIKNDNRIENLVMLTRGEHQREHNLAESRIKHVEPFRSEAAKKGAASRWQKERMKHKL